MTLDESIDALVKAFAADPGHPWRHSKRQEPQDEQRNDWDLVCCIDVHVECDRVSDRVNACGAKHKNERSGIDAQVYESGGNLRGVSNR